MGCISSKSSNHQQPNNLQVINSNQHLFSLVPSSTTNHTPDDAVLDLKPPKHDHALTIHTNLKTDDAVERCSSFHTVEEYDELLQRISNQSDAELAGVPVAVPTPVHETTDSTMDKKKQDMEFRTVASLRQWLHAPGGGSRRGDADAATTDYTSPKVGFSFYENNISSNSNSNTKGSEENSVLVKTGKQEEEESIVELVAAFDKYIQQLQIDEDNFLKQIHNMIN